MKHIFLNLKRFDVPRAMGGVNGIFPVEEWGAGIAAAIRSGVSKYPARFALFFPEAHLLSAAKTLRGSANAAAGCQGVHFENVAAGGNFGAFTTCLPAAAAVALGCKWTIVGHCEERNKLRAILREGGAGGVNAAVNALLKKSVECAMASGLNVLYCVGETADEQPQRERVLTEQLGAVPAARPGAVPEVVIAYEPVWAIGPGKTPPGAEYIRETAAFIKGRVGLPVVYGGGLKAGNAEMLAGIGEIDGGLIALTRFAGEVGFYPGEYLEIVEKYLGGAAVG